MYRTLSQLAIVFAGAALLSLAACTVHEDRDHHYSHYDRYPNNRYNRADVYHHDYDHHRDDDVRVNIRP